MCCIQDSIWNSLQVFHCFTSRIDCKFLDLMTFSFLQGKIFVTEKSDASQRLCAPERTRSASGPQFVEASIMEKLTSVYFLKIFDKVNDVRKIIQISKN